MQQNINPETSCLTDSLVQKHKPRVGAWNLLQREYSILQQTCKPTANTQLQIWLAICMQIQLAGLFWNLGLHQLTEELRLEGFSGDQLVQPPPQSEVHWSRLLRALSRWLLRTSKDRGFTGQLVPVPDHSHKWSYFLDLSSISCISTCACCLLSCYRVQLRRVRLSLFSCPIRNLSIYIAKIPPQSGILWT